MSDIVYLEKVNETVVKVDCNDEVAHNLYCRYSAYSPGYIFNPRYKMHVWDGMIHMYTPRSSTIPMGLLPDVIRYFDKEGIEYKLSNFTNMIDENIDDWFEQQMTMNMVNAPYPLRDYQKEAIYAALKNKKGILLSCTSSGKSLMIFNIIVTLLTQKKLKKTMIVVPNKTLVEQLYKDFIDYGWKNIDICVTKLYDEEKKNVDFRKPVLITTWQSIYKKEKSFFEDYQAVLCDECVNGDTLIKTPNGDKKIKDIKEGDLVITYNEKTKKFEPNKVLETHRNHISSKNAKMLRLELEDGKILELTENHPVYTTNRGWVRAGDLDENDDIEIINNNEISEDISK